MRKCTQCGGERIFKSRLQRGFGRAHGFFLEPSRKFWTRKGVRPEVWICADCRHVMFFLSERNIEKVYKDERDFGI